MKPPVLNLDKNKPLAMPRPAPKPSSTKKLGRKSNKEAGKADK